MSENIIVKPKDSQSVIERQLVNYCYGVLKLDKTDKGFIAGGAILSYLMRTKSDVDIFYNQEVDADNAFALFKELKEVKRTTKKKNAYQVAIHGHKLDLVKLPFASPIECIKQFDFAVAMVAVDRDMNFYCHKNWYEHVSAKSLVINELPFPVSTAWRVLKYIRKGFHICPTQYQKILTAVKNNTKPDDTLDGFYDAFD